MDFLKKVTQHLRHVCTSGRMLSERGLINTTDLLVATGATVILASAVGGAVIGTVDDAKYGKAQPDAQALGQAMQDFFSDTGKWPGQAEVADAADGTSTTAKLGKFLTTDNSSTAALPSFAAPGTFATSGTAACAGNSLEGFVGKTISATSTPAITDFLNINNYLVRKPDPALYPNWRGPYMQAEITSDPFGRVWLINTMPLFCAETVTFDSSSTGTNTAGSLGYAWIYIGGANRTVTTALTSPKLDKDGDDAGVNIGKLTKKTTSSGF